MSVNDEILLKELGYSIEVDANGFSVHLDNHCIWSGANLVYVEPETIVGQINVERYTRMAWKEAWYHFSTFKQEIAKEMWQRLGKVWVNDDGILQERFLGFLPGTDQEEVWHWFEATFEVRVYDLMYPTSLFERPFTVS